jgi:hypothetical protein
MFEIESKLCIMSANSQVAITNTEKVTAGAVPVFRPSFLLGKIIPIKVRLPTARMAHESVTKLESGRAHRVNDGTLGSPTNSTVSSWCKK